ncbi:MAG TPA: SdrD B-like domain-containing protein, partial [Pseudonocardiaceae bacterium]
GAGDLLRACVVNGGYQLESGGNCGPASGAGTGNGLGPGGGEYFTSIWNGSDAVHGHTATGGTTYLPGHNDEWSTRFDPFDSDTWHKGVSLYGGGGSPSQGIEIGGSELNRNIAFGKGDSLADIEKLCDAAPVQIGDRVWYDADRDGTQGAAEPGVAGVKVTLKDTSGNTVATTATDASGAYYFGTSGGVKTNTTYSVAFDYSGATGLPVGVTATDLSWTTQNVGADRCLDSDVNSAGVAAVTVGAAGDVNHCVDAGLVGPQYAIGDRVWYDGDRDGIQDPGEPGIGGVKATLKNASGTVVATTTTDSMGTYRFQSLPSGRYRVCFDKSTLPARYADGTFTRQSAADGNGTDSAVDPSNGCTGYVTLDADHRIDDTRDAGIVTPPNTVGDRVWFDKKHDGVQDPGDPGVAGVQVRLMSPTGYVIGTATTDAHGVYQLTNLPDGTYRICFAKSAFPSGDGLTTADVHGGNGTDSAADPRTGCTDPVTLGPDHRADLALDAGLVKLATAPPE